MSTTETEGARITRETNAGIGDAVIEYLTETNFEWLEERESRVVQSVLDALLAAHPELATSDEVARVRDEWITSSAITEAPR